MGGGTYGPDLDVMPLDDGMHAHERRPAAVGRLEGVEFPAVGIRPAGADEDGFDAAVGLQVAGEGIAHGRVGVPGEGEVVGLGGGGDEGVDGWEGVRGGDVDCGEVGGE